MNKEDLKTIRTYTSDMAEAIRNNEVSVAKIVIEEKKKREEEDYYYGNGASKKNKIFFILSGLIILSIAIFAIFWSTKKAEEKETLLSEQTENIKTFITYESIEKIDITNIEYEEDLLSKIKNGENNTSGVKAIIFTEKEGDVYRELNTYKFFNLLIKQAPGSLVRALQDKFLLGKNLNNQEKSSFLIFKTKDYNQAYSSMLTWENTILEDLEKLFEIKINDVQLYDKNLDDLIINNRDIRVLYKENGEILLCYIFINRDELIVANNLDTLKEIVDRVILRK